MAQETTIPINSQLSKIKDEIYILAGLIFASENLNLVRLSLYKTQGRKLNNKPILKVFI